MGYHIECRNCHATMNVANPKRIYCSQSCRDMASRKAYGTYSGRTRQHANTTGAISELRACVDLMQRGYDVYRALSQNSKCDLAVVHRDKLWRVQVRTAYRVSSGNTFCPLKDNDSFDVLALVLPDSIEYRPDLPSIVNSGIDTPQVTS